KFALNHSLLIACCPSQRPVLPHDLIKQNNCPVQRVFTHAGHCRLCREEEGFFSKRIIGSLLSNKFKLRLCVREVLASVIQLSQLHSNFRSERRGPMLFEEALCEINNFRFVATT